MAAEQFDVTEYWRRGSGEATVNQLVQEMATDLGLADPKHAHPDGPISHVLNVSRRNGTPHQPKHCGCQSCTYGFTHVAQVIV